MTTCAWCGRSSDDPATVLSWTTQVERGRRTWTCETCSREHVRAMEAKLPTEWW